MPFPLASKQPPVAARGRKKKKKKKIKDDHVSGVLAPAQISYEGINEKKKESLQGQEQSAGGAFIGLARLLLVYFFCISFRAPHSK